jgi:asparagine synthase (glutamine-hydrolysing)
MSGIAGILRMGGVVELAELPFLGEALEKIGPDGCYTLAEGSIGVVYRPYYCTMEERNAVWPVRKGKCFILVDGRIDNRTELVDILDMDISTASDAAIILEAYFRWSHELCGHLLGDFAFVIWDADKNEMLLARDPFGIRPLYYATNGSTFMWSSTVESLLGAGLNKKVDDLFVASFLWFVPDESRSPFESIHPVKPGNIIVVSERGIISHRYWDIRNCIGKVRHESDRQYEEHFLVVVKEAIRTRLRASTRVMLEVSGGLDSSFIACIAQSLLGNSAQQALATLSYLYPGVADRDKPFINAVESRVGCPHFHINEDVRLMLSGCGTDKFLGYPSILFCFPIKLSAPFRALNQCNARIVLTGEVGDAVFRNEELYPLHLGSRARDESIGSLFRELLAWSVSEGLTVWRVAWECLLRPSIFSTSPPRPTIPAWLNHEFATKSGLSDYVHYINKLHEGIREPHLASQCWTLLTARAQIASGCQNGYRTNDNYAEVRYPYLDLRLLAFMLSIPPDQVSRPGERRSIMRRAARDILPEIIRTRLDKTGVANAVVAAVRTNWSSISQSITRSLAADAGYVNSGRIIAELQKLRNGRGNADGFSLIKYLAVENWLQNVAGLQRANP